MLQVKAVHRYMTDPRRWLSGVPLRVAPAKAGSRFTELGAAVTPTLSGVPLRVAPI